MLWPFLVALAIHLLFGTLALFAGRSSRTAIMLGTIGCVAASIVGIGAAAHLLLFGGHVDAQMAWHVPIGALHIGVYALSAFFLLCIYLVTGIAAIYGAGYFRDHGDDRRVGPLVFFFILLAASMAGVALARDGILFLIAWEVMSLSGFFLVTFDDQREDVRRAGTVYLIASHVGVLFLFVLFALFAQHGGDFNFSSIAAAGALSPEMANACFLLALVGFGTKAGFWFLHTWLPEAHPAAPSHVSASMSGVMIKMGIYGVLRVLTLLGPPPLWWGITVIAIGALSGVLGVLHALAQHDLKRLLAYHSVENVGIITLGIGLGLLGQSAANPEMAFLGYGGAILHTLNHGLFKGLLFQGAGSVLHATGTKAIDALGGLSRKMPTTALTFLIGAIAISGLPPLNGFVSEWLIYIAAFRGGTLNGPGTVAALAVIPALALIGGLASACFVKAYGIVFLGAPRTAAVEAAHPAPAGMRAAMIIGALLCVAIGIWPEYAFRLVERPALLMAGTASAADPILAALVPITRVALSLFALAGLLALVRRALLRRREAPIEATWGCGYEAPSPRMQYTASSFADPVLVPFEGVLHRSVHEEAPHGYFPREAHYEVHSGDIAGEQIIVPAIEKLVAVLGKLRAIQQGRVQMYLVYIFVTLVGVFLWQLPGGGP